jgi:8-oxo-dGTP pyrophosphatase MutT (NUDIX family)
MGAGILPVCLVNGKILFLFGKEQLHDKHPGWADFGGGTDKGESPLQTATREGSEELTGFLGNQQDIKTHFRNHPPLIVKYQDPNYPHPYWIYLYKTQYDPNLPIYYNNNQRFLQTRLPQTILKKSKIFEKAEIRWIKMEELIPMRGKFRSFYRPCVDLLVAHHREILTFLQN